MKVSTMIMKVIVKPLSCQPSRYN